MNDIVVTAISSGLIGIIATAIFSRRKTKAEAQANELDNVEKAVRHYREMLDDVAERYERAVERQDQLIVELSETKSALKGALADIEKLEQRVKLLADENRALLEELYKYKQLNGKQK